MVGLPEILSTIKHNKITDGKIDTKVYVTLCYVAAL